MNMDHYYLYDEVVRCLEGFRAHYPDLVRVEAIGSTYEGRDILLLTLTKGGNAAEKPALSIDGCIHASEVASTMAVLYSLEKLLEGCGKDPVITGLLETHTVYAIPMINPDGAQRFLTTPGRVRGSVEPFYPQQDGVVPQDINGDGEILEMRVPDPAGRYKISDFDPRVMEPRKPNDIGGTYYRVVSEGLVQGDDRVDLRTAPPREGLDPNRQFPFDWLPSVPDEAGQNTSGPHPLHDMEVRSLYRFVQAHPNICFEMNYHTYGGLHISPLDFCPGEKADPEDAERFAQMGSMFHDLTGYQTIGIFPPGATDIAHGSYTTYLYFSRGVPAYVTELWDFHRQADPDRPGQWSMFFTSCREQFVREHETQLRWDAEKNGGAGFADWTPFLHPQLGMVEIGGWKDKFVKWNPPIPFLPGVLEKAYQTCLASLSLLPQVTASPMHMSRTDKGHVCATFRLSNTGFLPTSASRQAVLNGYGATLKLTLSSSLGTAQTEIPALDGFSARQVMMELEAASGDELVLTVSGERSGTQRFVIPAVP